MSSSFLFTHHPVSIQRPSDNAHSHPYSNQFNGSPFIWAGQSVHHWVPVVQMGFHCYFQFSFALFFCCWGISFNGPGMLKSIQLNLWRCKLWGQINSDLAPKPLEMPLAFCCPVLGKNDYFSWPIRSVISPPSKLLTSFSFQMLATEGVGLIFEFKVSFEPWGKEKGQECGDIRDSQNEPWTIVPPASSTAPLNCFFFFFPNTASCLPPVIPNEPEGVGGWPGNLPELCSTLNSNCRSQILL